MTEDEKRAAFASYIATMRNRGWSDADVAEYTAQVRILMGKGDDATIDLFPVGLYATAQSARDDAVKYWQSTK